MSVPLPRPVGRVRLCRLVDRAALVLAVLAPVAGPLLTASPSSASTAPAVRLSLVRVVAGLDAPLFLTNAGDGTGRLFVVEQAGRIRIIAGGRAIARPFLDISARVSSGGERGLLGLAFHPAYRSNHRFYVDYTDLRGNTVISEFRSSTSDPSVAVPTSERVLLRIPQPYPNHNGGSLAFGPDGYLYIGSGDGGSGGDPGNRGQSLSTRLGKLLRIDVDHTSGTLRYAIPATNPFVGRRGLKEIWAYGLRNPWRFSFDRLTGDLWIGDVGQDRWEEINRATRASGGGRGLDFGWRILEGRACYDPPTGCSTRGMTAPLAVYGHGLGCAVVGGYVYRGGAYPFLRGAYLFGDYCSGRIWSVAASGPAAQTPHLLLSSGHTISSFGRGENGELYVTDLSSGEVLRIVAATA